MSTVIRNKETVTVTQASSDIESLLERVRIHDARIGIEQDGATVAALVSAEDLDRLNRLDLQDQLKRVMDAMSAPFSNVPESEFESEVNRIVAEVKAEMRAERMPAKPQAK